MSRRFFISLLLLVLCSHSMMAQPAEAKGKVVDRQTGEPLAFVNVTYGSPSRGTTTDIDGYFAIQVPDAVDSLRFSYVGYHTRRVPVDALLGDSSSTLSLKSKPYQLEGVVVRPGSNPANRIVRRAIENRGENNPENLSSFTYRSYNKFVFTIDSVQRKSPITSGDTNSTPDSSVIALRELTQEQHFMVMESVTQRKYRSPGQSKEKVLASRVSGFKEPSLSFIATQFQSFSFYNDFIELGNDRYLNPISKKSWQKYFFNLADTIYTGMQDTVFVISYRPKRGRIFEALNGVMHIHTHNYALQRVIAEPWDPPADLSVKIQQQYEMHRGQWFPHQFNTRLKFKNVLLAAGEKDYYMVGEGRTYIYDTQLNPPLDDEDFGHVELSIPPSAYRRSSDFWSGMRPHPLTDKDRRTYRMVDSLGEAHHFDRRLETFQTLTTGYLPVGPVDVDLKKLLDYNRYEGLRLGVGLRTNESLSGHFKTGGYLGYGFADKELKYGGSLELELHRPSETTLHLTHINDVVESGGYRFLRETGFFSTETYRSYLIKTMDRVSRWQAALSFRALDYLKVRTFLRQSTIDPYTDYTFDAGKNTYEGNFYTTEAGIRLRYAHGEDFVETHRGKFSLGTEAPIFYGNIIRGFDGLGGDLDYTKYEAAISSKFKTRNLGNTHLWIEGGYSQGDVPAFNLYKGRGSFGSNLSIYSANSFATMGLDEFMAGRFVSLFWTHNFRSLLWPSKKFTPHVKWVNNAGWGWLGSETSHSGVALRDYSRGYFETGLVVDRLFSMGLFHYGFGVFYRYGPYAFDRPAENFAYKLSFRFAIN